jgi:hypothetical protein
VTESSWINAELPILELLLAHEASNPGTATQELIQACQGDKAFAIRLAALIDDGYVTGAAAHWALGRGDPIITAGIVRLTPKGRRAVGQWPNEDAGINFLRILEEKLVDLPDGDVKTRMSDLVTAARSIGTEVLSNVITSLIKSQVGIQ